ncbi:PepSY domain-containing protein [Bacillus testis]|uniref:PepSY domain-containing protein n=1 Tax=Bacillus testis TaxID=1622072 RepID=UPI00067F07FB|nr:PepSY domain-containing protein [Bacillus testis]
MKWQSIVLGAAAGFICGYAAKCVIDNNNTPSPDDVLTHVKDAVKENGKVIGSWILMKPESYVKNGLQYEVFKGGLTKIDNDEQTQFEFVADATTGTVLDLIPQT